MPSGAKGQTHEVFKGYTQAQQQQRTYMGPFLGGSAQQGRGQTELPPDYDKDFGSVHGGGFSKKKGGPKYTGKRK